MPKTILFIFFILIQLISHSQLSDIISVQKKNGRIVKSFVAGSPIIFITTNGHYIEGFIHSIKNDSIFITSYDIRYYPSQFGVSTMGPVTTYESAFGCREIKRVQITSRQRFTALKADRLLMIGGAGYFALNIINSDYLRQPITERKNLLTLGISLGAFGTGLLINKSTKDRTFTRKKHKIVYVNLR